MDKNRLLALLEEHDYLQKRVARALSVSHSTVDRWMRVFGLCRPRDLSRKQLVAAADSAGGDLAVMARRLRVSQHGLRLRLAAVGLPGGTKRRDGSK